MPLFCFHTNDSFLWSDRLFLIERKELRLYIFKKEVFALAP
jgi:hypothetical protein